MERINLNEQCVDTILFITITSLLGYIGITICAACCCRNNTNERRLKEENSVLRSFIIQGIENRIIEGLGVKNGYYPDEDECCKEN